MANFNKVLLMGNLTRDPDMRYTPSGMAVAALGLAVNRKWRDAKTNELREEVTFVEIDIWGKQAETANQYLRKGRSVFIEGRLRLDQWDDKQTGQKRSRLKVVAERLQFVGPAPAGQAGAPAARPAQPGRPAPQQAPMAPEAGPAPEQDLGPQPEAAPDDLEIREESVPF
jgi:single-strand DNA-binding protein